MGRLATYLAVETGHIDAIWDLGDAEFRNAFFELEENESPPRLDIDKIWDVLHCTLTGVSARDPIEGNRFSEAIVGVYPKLYDDEDYGVFVSVIDNEDLPPILSALNEVDQERLKSLFDAGKLKQQRVYPNLIWQDSAESLIAEMDSTLKRMKEFFSQYVDTELHILATIV